MKLLSNAELESLSIEERREYFQNLKKQCQKITDGQLHFGQPIIKNAYPLLRRYDLELQGEENIPTDSNAIFLANHSNSHDIFTAYEVLSLLQRKGSVMVATDCLNPLSNFVFNISYATMFDRRIPEERHNSVFSLSSRILNGYSGWIFGESTWNLHPTKPMHNLRTGASNISAITQVPIIPTIIEYIEEDGLFEKESQLIKKCIIRFGKPIMIDCSRTIISQTNEIKNIMSKSRQEIWRDNNINKDDIDPIQYLWNTLLKKFTLGFDFNSGYEQQFLLFLDGEPIENEYTLDQDGNFVPGITEKDSELGTLLRTLFRK